jgi:hypothetical protein
VSAIKQFMSLGSRSCQLGWLNLAACIELNLEQMFHVEHWISLPQFARSTNRSHVSRQKTPVARKRSRR